jgi:toxin ParE1/3/4
MGRKPPIVVRRPAAIVDVIGIADYLADHASISVADRFTASVKKTAEKLARMPGIGSRWESGEHRLGDVRFLPVTRFPNHVLFYRPIEGGIELLRVLHGARDLERELDERDEDNT